MRACDVHQTCGNGWWILFVAVAAKPRRLGGSRWERPVSTAGSGLAAWPTNGLVRAVPTSWIGTRCAVMWRLILIGPKRSGRDSSRCLARASGTRCNDCRSPIKKRIGYKERDPRQRRQFLRRRERLLRHGKQPVHIDECGFASSTARRYGYAPKGQRVDGLVSGHRRPRTSLIAAQMDGQLREPLLFEGTCDTVVFNAWLKTRLCPRLTAQHLVIMDNAAFHKSPETAELIKATGATLLFLPPYSPDFNPIEHDFAALKKRREYHDQTTLDDIVKTYQ